MALSWRAQSCCQCRLIMDPHLKVGKLSGSKVNRLSPPPFRCKKEIIVIHSTVKKIWQKKNCRTSISSRLPAEVLFHPPGRSGTPPCLPDCLYRSRNRGSGDFDTCNGVVRPAARRIGARLSQRVALANVLQTRINGLDSCRKR